MKLTDAEKLINRVVDMQANDMLVLYYYGEIMDAIRTIESRKNVSADSIRSADIVFWKIALRTVSEKG